VTFTGQNGATVASKPALHVPGCGPALAASLRHARGARPVLRIKVHRHPDGGKIARLSLKLPKQLRLNRARAERETAAVGSGKSARIAVKVKGRRTVTVSGLPKKGASTVSLKLDHGAVKLSGKARRKLRRHRLRLAYKIVAVETDGDRFTVRTRARARR
jgi:hypothetical protein